MTSSSAFSLSRACLGAMAAISLFAASAHAVAVGPHTVNFVDVRYNYPATDQSTWYYTVTSHSGPAISHIVFQLNLDCVEVLDAGTWGPTQDDLNSGGGSPVVVSPDPTTGVTGLKFDEGFTGSQTKNYYFTLDANYLSNGLINVAIKAGGTTPTGMVTGPSVDCDEVPECVFDPDDCDDGNACTTDTCDPIDGCEYSDVVCEDDGNVCTTETCDPDIGCVTTNNTDPCDDGQFCTENDICGGGSCAGTPYTPPSCDDGNGCTDDACDPALNDGAGACTNTNNTDQCDDGQFCTEGDVCAGGTCAGTPYTPPSCDDENVCTDDACDPSLNDGAGACTNTNNSGPCDDGQFCTDDICSGGSCAGTPYTPPSCDDENVCTDDACDPSLNEGAGACSNTNNTGPCDDGQFCTSDICSGGSCAGTPYTPPSCDDENVCTDDACDPSLNEGAGACTNTNNSGPCDDGQFCTTDICSGGSCSGTPYTPPSCDDENVCTDDACDPSLNDGAGACSNTNNSGPCDDGQFCTDDICSGGSCVGTPSTPPSCDDSNDCTDDSCDPAANDGAGACSNVSNSDECDDGNACTNDVCMPEGGCMYTDVTCEDDGNTCTDESCDPDDGCVTTNNSDLCNDGQFCTENDVCSGGTCAGTPYTPGSCLDADECTEDLCDPSANDGAGACSNVFDPLCPGGGGGDQGCTPGYWKNHLSAWGPTGLLPTQSIDSVFANAAGFAGIGSATLHEGLGFGGGPGLDGAARILLRAAIAALLNALHPDVEYPTDAAQIVADVDAALASGDRNAMLALATTLDNDNNLGCPLGGGAPQACDPTEFASAVAGVSAACSEASDASAYRRCVRLTLKQASSEGSLGRQCRSAVRSCALRSLITNPDGAICLQTTATGKERCRVVRGDAQCRTPKNGSSCVSSEADCCAAIIAGGCP